LALAFLIAGPATSAPLTQEDGRAWILTDRRLVEADLESGTELRSTMVEAGESLLSPDRSGPPFIQTATGELLAVERATGEVWLVETSL
jgi:hypothetical protein